MSSTFSPTSINLFMSSYATAEGVVTGYDVIPDLYAVTLSVYSLHSFSFCGYSLPQTTRVPKPQCTTILKSFASQSRAVCVRYNNFVEVL